MSEIGVFFFSHYRKGVQGLVNLLEKEDTVYMELESHMRVIMCFKVCFKGNSALYHTFEKIVKSRESYAKGHVFGDRPVLV